MFRRLLFAVLILTFASAPTFAGMITMTGTGVTRANGNASYNLAPIMSFDAAVAASLPPNTIANSVTLDSLLTGEGLLGGPAPGAHFSGATTMLPAGMGISAVSGQPALNSGMPNSTAVFVDLQGSMAGTSNLYYLGAPGEGNTEPNRIQFKGIDVGTNADNMRILRPVSFDSMGRAIEVQPGERGVLEAGAFRFSLDPSLNVYGMKISFIDTETNAALNTGVFNIKVNGAAVPQVFHVPAGGNDNEYFVGFFANQPLTSFDIRLGWINGNQDGGDGVLVDLTKIELMTIPEPATLLPFALALFAAAHRRAPRFPRDRRPT